MAHFLFWSFNLKQVTFLAMTSISTEFFRHKTSKKICYFIYIPLDLPQINNSPHVGAEPHGSTRVSLVFADQDGMRNREKPHQRAMLQEFQDLRLICEAPVDRMHT